MQPRDPLRPGERLFSFLLVVFAGYAVWESYGISGFSGLATGGVMPMLAAGVMVLSGLVIFADTVRRPRSAEPGLRGLVAYLFPRRVVLFGLLVAAYAGAIPVLGFLPASGALLVAAIWALWSRGLIAALAIALLSVGAIYVLFRVVFRVVLPGGNLWS
jgi:putative tricarboxylic transport membrane protein